MRIGSMLLRWRAAEGLTVREMAKALGISAATLFRVENGEEMSGETLAAVLRWALEKDSTEKNRDG